jgi:hypothetical protein
MKNMNLETAIKEWEDFDAKEQDTFRTKRKTKQRKPVNEQSKKYNKD